MAVRQARLEQPELRGSSQERMVYGPTATRGKKRIDLSSGIAWFGDILKAIEGRSSPSGPVRSLACRWSVSGSSQRGRVRGRP